MENNHFLIMTTQYAFFDFDGTLTRCDTVLPFLKFCCQNSLIFYLKILPIIPILIGYLLGWVDNAIAKECVIRTYLHGWHEADIQDKAAEFVAQKLPHLLLPEGMARLAEHQARGDICVLVSASPDWYLHIWGKQHGFAVVLATKMETVSHHITGKISGNNCHGIAKVWRINTHFGASCWQHSVAYSDAAVDMPMLQHAKQGFLLNSKTGKFESITPQATQNKAA